jgi:hypothetical protein
MIFDATTLLSDAQAITATAASTNIIDTKATGTVYGAAAALKRDIGKGKKIPLRVQVVEAFNTLTSLTFALQVDDNASFSSPKTVATTGAVPLASLTAGYYWNIDHVPIGTDERYVRLNYTVAGTAPTTGKVTAGIVMATQTNE